MKKTKKILSLILAGAMMMSLTACGGKTEESKSSSTETTTAQATTEGAATTGEKTADGKQYKIGVLQLVQHTALDAANKGFIKALDDAGLNYVADQ